MPDKIIENKKEKMRNLILKNGIAKTAKLLKLDISYVSRIANSKQLVTFEQADKIIERLEK